jgi:hypothetical protein
MTLSPGIVAAQAAYAGIWISRGDYPRTSLI